MVEPRPWRRIKTEWTRVRGAPVMAYRISLSQGTRKTSEEEEERVRIESNRAMELSSIPSMAASDRGSQPWNISGWIDWMVQVSLEKYIP